MFLSLFNSIVFCVELSCFMLLIMFIVCIFKVVLEVVEKSVGSRWEDVGKSFGSRW